MEPTTTANGRTAPRRTGGRAAAVVVAVVLAVAGGGAGLWWWLARPSLARYDGVVAALAAGRVPVDPQGYVDLAKTSFPGLTPRDQAYATRRPDGSFVALFPTEYGHGREILGLLYTSRPLTDADTFTRETAINYDRRFTAVGPWGRVSLDARLDPHWYRASVGVH